MHTSNVASAWLLAAHDTMDGAAKRAGLGLREVFALTLVANRSDATVDWLRERVGLSQPGTVRLVDRLAAAGMLQRSARKGRSVGLVVTPSGRRALRKWIELRDAALAEVTRGLDADDIDVLHGLLRKSIESTARDRVGADRTCRTCDWPACGRDCPVDQSVCS
jgi:DNA-binding MarR family transcriptional regulator